MIWAAALCALIALFLLPASIRLYQVSIAERRRREKLMEYLDKVRRG